MSAAYVLVVRSPLTRTYPLPAGPRVRLRLARRGDRAAVRSLLAGRGVGYDNPHRVPGHVNQQEHLPEGREDLRFYRPDDAEAALREQLARIREQRARDV